MNRLKEKGLCVLLSAILASGSLLTACGSSKPAVEDATMEVSNAVSVETASPEVRTVSISSNFAATIEADTTVTVVPKASGEVVEKNFEIGDHVNEGDLLFRVDDESAKISLQQAQATLKSAEAGYTAQQATAASTKAAATQTLGTMGTTEMQLQQAVDSAKAGVQQAANNLGSAQNSVDFYADNESDAHGNANDAEKSKKRAKKLVNQLKSIRDTYNSKKSSDGEAAALAWLKDQGYSGENALNSAITEAQTAVSTAKSSEKSYESAEDSANFQKKSAEYTAGNAEMNYYVAQNSQAYAEQQLQDYETYGKAATLYSVNAQVVGADASLTSSEATVQQAKSTLENAKMALDNTTITAPVSGTITAINVSLHNMASSGSSAYVIESDSLNKIVFYVAEESAANMKVGNTAVVTKNGEEYEAVITSIGSTLDADKNLFKVEAVAQGNPGFINGSNVSVRTITREAANTITVPLDAVYYEDEQAYVYVNENGIARRVNIEVGISDEKYIAVESGLTTDDEVIVSWSSQLTDGSEIDVTATTVDKSKKAAVKPSAVTETVSADTVSGNAGEKKDTNEDSAEDENASESATEAAE